MKGSNALEMLSVAFGKSILSKEVLISGTSSLQKAEKILMAMHVNNRYNVEAVKKIVIENRRITIREVAEEVIRRLREAIQENVRICEKQLKAFASR